MSFFQSLMQFDVALRTGFRYVSNKRRNPNVTSRFLHLFYFSTSLLHCSILISVNNQLIIFLRGFRKKLLISLFLGVSDPYATFFRSLPIPDPLYVPDSGTTFLPIVACSQILLAYWIPVQLSSDRRLFPDPPCVPDSGTFPIKKET